MEIYRTYIVRICRSDDSEHPSFSGMLEEVGVQGNNSRMFANFEELKEILCSDRRVRPRWIKQEAGRAAKNPAIRLDDNFSAETD